MIIANTPHCRGLLWGRSCPSPARINIYSEPLAVQLLLVNQIGHMLDSPLTVARNWNEDRYIESSIIYWRLSSS